MSCRTGKVPYRAEHEARVALVGAIIARNLGKTQRQETRVYRCGFCGCWHLTSRIQQRPVREPWPTTRIE